MKSSAPRASVGRNVLLVEDEPRLRDMLCRALKDMGFDALPAASAEAAARTMEQREFDIMVLDLNLPGMDGMQFLELVRRLAPNVQVIILTGFGDLKAAKRAIHLDVVEFLTKPCALGDLEIALDRARRRCQALMRLPDLENVEKKEIPAFEVPPAPSPAASAVSLEEIEQHHILSALKKNHGNRALTAAELGISLRKLYYRLNEYQRAGAMQ